MFKWSLAIALIGAINHFVGFIPSEAHEIDSMIPDYISESCHLQMIRDYRSETTYERYQRRLRGELKCYETEDPSEVFNPDESSANTN